MKKVDAMRGWGLMIAGVAIIVGGLSFVPNSRAPFGSPEVSFSEPSEHGLNIMPASCALSPTYYHTTLSGTSDGGGYYLPSGASDYGAYSSNAGMYVCASNSSGNEYFIPAHSANEINYFKSYPPPGVSAY